MTTATDTGFMEMRLGKVVGVTTEQDDPCCFLVLDGVSKDRHLPIQIGRTEAFNLSATLTGLDFPRPMSPLLAGGCDRCGLTGWSQPSAGGQRTVPPLRWKARQVWRWWTPGRVTR